MARQAAKILVTGGAGFIGSAFVRRAVAAGYRVAVVDKLTYAGDLSRLGDAKSKVSFHKTDIADGTRMLAVFKKERPRLVAHFAAESHVDRSIANDAAFIRTNIGGTHVLLTAARQAGIEKFLHVSTDEVYGEIAQGKFKETDPLKPNSPYSSSKGAADLLVKAYVHTFKFPAVIVRPSNNYGPWQYPEKLIPVAVGKALRGQKVPVYARGLNMREWLHVSDCADAAMKVLERGRLGETYNIGSGDERTNIDVVKSILAILGRPQTLISFVKDRPGHDWRYALDCGKLRRELGWRPQVSFEQGLADTVAWYQQNARWLKEKNTC